jgi:hypothetical protein
MMRAMDPWTLADGEKLNREHPRSFFIPSRERRNRLVVGEDVKLAFETPDGRTERKWVTITEAEPPRFSGILANIPTIIDLAVGARVEFEARHVIAIHEDPEALGYRPDEQAAASRRVIERDQAPGVVAWEPDASCFLSVAGPLVNEEFGSDVLLLGCWLGTANRAGVKMQRRQRSEDERS